MATEVGFGYVSLVPSMRGFTAATQRALARENLGGRVANEMGRGAGPAGAKAGGLFSRAFSNAAKRGNGGVYVAGLIRNLRTYAFAIGGATGLTVGFGLKTAASMEQAQVAFTTMLGSAKQARGFLAELTKFAQTTPFDLPGVVSSAQRLLAFGFAAKQVLPTLTAIGDASAGLGGGPQLLEQITTAIGQIQAKGRVQSDEILQLTEAGIPALRILANSFGTTTGKMQKFITAGIVPAKKAIPALLAGLENGTNGLAGQTARFGGLMQKQSTTLGGIFSNLRDTVSQGLAKAVGPLVPVLERVLPQAMARLPGLFTAAANGMRDFLTGLGLVRDQTPGASGALEQLGGFVRGIGTVLSGVFGFISKHSTLFKVLGVEILGAIVALKLFTAVMIAVDIALDANPISLIVLAIGALAAGFIAAWKSSETFRNVVTGVFKFVGQSVILWARIMYDNITLPFKGVLKLVASLPGFIVGPLKGAAQSALDALNSVDGALDRTSQWLDDLGRPRVINVALHIEADAQSNALLHAVAPGTIGRALGDSDKPLSASAFKQALTQAKKPAANAGSSVGKTITSSLAGAIPKAKQSAKELADAILGPLRDLQQKAADLAKGITDAITGSTGLGSLTSRLDIMGNQTKQSLAGLVKGLIQQRRAVLAFRKELQTLGKRGLAGSDLNTIANLGLEQGGALAQTLLGATHGQLRQISGLTAGISSGASLIARDRTQATFGAQIGAELVRTMHALEKKETSLDRKTINNLEAAFKAAVKDVRPYVNITEIDSRAGRRVLATLSR